MLDQDFKARYWAYIAARQHSIDRWATAATASMSALGVVLGASVNPWWAVVFAAAATATGTVSFFSRFSDRAGAAASACAQLSTACMDLEHLWTDVSDNDVTGEVAKARLEAVEKRIDGLTESLSKERQVPKLIEKARRSVIASRGLDELEA